MARLAQGDGTATVDDLRAEGFTDAAIAAAVTTSSKDKRVKPRAELGIYSGVPFVLLTRTGWQAAGHPSRSTRHPTAESAAHAAAPQQLAAWLATALQPHPVRVDVVTGQACRDFSELVKAKAWGRIQGAGDTTGAAGSLTGGLVPDALLVERWDDPRLYAGAWGHEPETLSDAAEQVLGLEVERSAKREDPLRWKVEKWQAALDLGALYAVVWVVSSATVAERLMALGVGQGRQLLVSARSLGMDGEPMPELDGAAARWWPLRINPSRAAQ